MYLYSSLSPELKLCSEELITSGMSKNYNTMLKKYNVKSHKKQRYGGGKVKHIIYVNNKNVYLNTIKRRKK